MKNKKHLVIISFLLFFSTSYSQSWLWGVEGTNSITSNPQICTDNLGNVYLISTYRDTISFGSIHLSTVSILSTYLVKLNSKGNFIWAKQMNAHDSSDYGFPGGVSTDNFGHIYVSGSFYDTISFGTATLIANSPYGNSFLVKYDSAGNVIWAKQALINATSASSGGACATDKSGNIYQVGSFYDTVSFGSIALHNLTEWGDVFIVKYDTGGNVKWAKQSKSASSASSPGLYSITANAEGYIYATGAVLDTATFGTTTFISNGSGAAIIVKYDTAGNYTWGRQAESPSSAGGSNGNSITADSMGNAYIAGSYTGEDTISFGNDTLIKMNQAFLVKYKPNGDVDWLKGSGGYIWGGTSVALDNKERLYMVLGGWVGGPTNWTVVWGKDTLSVKNCTSPTVILELDTAGNWLCGSIMKTGGINDPQVACSPTGSNVYFAGELTDTITFGKNFLFDDSASNERPFVARWQPCSIITSNAVLDIINTTVKVYPNPGSGIFTIELSGSNNPESLEVYNMLGEKVAGYHLLAANSIYQINLSGQPNGIYFYHITDIYGNYIESGKMMIEK